MGDRVSELAPKPSRQCENEDFACAGTNWLLPLGASVRSKRQFIAAVATPVRRSVVGVHHAEPLLGVRPHERTAAAIQRRRLRAPSGGPAQTVAVR